MRVATWNVERVNPKGWKIAPAQRQRMAEVDADIWILTETHVDHSPGDGCRGIHTPPVTERRPEAERWVGIWSRHPMTPIDEPAPRGRGTLAALIDTPIGELVVYGCVIPWANEPTLGDGTPATMWRGHAETIEQIDLDLTVIRDRHPGVPIVLAGDFNQDRDGSGWYGTKAVRQQLSAVLDRHDLACPTAIDVVAAGLLRTQHLVDHICITKSLATDNHVRCWEATSEAGVRLSDHPTVAIDARSAEDSRRLIAQ
jgi:endonuclease/exonuclease/phosphatase family metal-dependent hydrolase